MRKKDGFKRECRNKGILHKNLCKKLWPRKSCRGERSRKLKVQLPTKQNWVSWELSFRRDFPPLEAMWWIICKEKIIKIICPIKLVSVLWEKGCDISKMLVSVTVEVTRITLKSPDNRAHDLCLQAGSTLWKWIPSERGLQLFWLLTVLTSAAEKKQVFPYSWKKVRRFPYTNTSSCEIASNEEKKQYTK